MKLERERAQRMGYPSPIHDTYEDTSKNYDACLDLVLQVRFRRETLIEQERAERSNEMTGN